MSAQASVELSQINTEAVALYTGAHGKIFNSSRDGEPCILKSFVKNKKLSDSPETFYKKEKEIAETLDNKYVMSIVDSDDKELKLYFEKAEHGDLFEFITDNDIGIEDILDIMNQLIRAVKYLQKNQIVHRDLKPENIVLVSFNPIIVRIIDFSFYVKFGERARVSGTSNYIRPDIRRRTYHVYDGTEDDYSLVVIFSDMLANCKHKSKFKALARLIKEKRNTQEVINFLSNIRYTDKPITDDFVNWSASRTEFKQQMKFCDDVYEIIEKIKIIITDSVEILYGKHSQNISVIDYCNYGIYICNELLSRTVDLSVWIPFIVTNVSKLLVFKIYSNEIKSKYNTFMIAGENKEMILELLFKLKKQPIMLDE